MKIEGKEYSTIWFKNNVVKIIDQTKLPHQFIIKDLKTVNVNDTHDLATYESRKKFLAACTDKGAVVSYDKQSSKTAKKIVLEFIAKNFK